MPPDQPQYSPQWAQQFFQGFGMGGQQGQYGGYGNPYGYGGYGAQPTAGDTKVGAFGKGGGYGGAIGMAASAIPAWYESAHHAATMQPQQVAHPNYGLYQTMQGNTDAYGGPTVGSGLKNAATGALGGAATGASIGSAVPIVGTVAGGIIGAVGGAVGGLTEAYRANDLHDQWQKEVDKQNKEAQQHNAYVSAWQQRTREKQAQLNGFGQPQSYY